jgi:hypothetical protein
MMKKGQGLLQGVEAFAVQVSSVHDVDGAGFGKWFVEDVNLVDSPWWPSE